MAAALFGNNAHLWMWDENAMTRELASAGFTDIRRCSFGDAGDPAFAAVENQDRFVSDGIVEVAIECRRR